MSIFSMVFAAITRAWSARGAHACHNAQQLLVYAMRASAQPAHAAMRAQLRSCTAHLPVAHTAPTPTIGSFMTSSAIARRTLVSYVDHGGSQHRVVQHHEQQVGQREHGRG